MTTMYREVDWQRPNARPGPPTSQPRPGRRRPPARRVADLLVPNIKQADTLDFAAASSRAYEDLIRQGPGEQADRARTSARHHRDAHQPGHRSAPVQSVPRLMAGQAAIIGVGAIDYPAEITGAPTRDTSADIGIAQGRH